MLFVLLIVLFIDAEVNLTLEGTDIQGIPHSVSVLFIASHQLAAAVALEAAEDRNTFFTGISLSDLEYPGFLFYR